MAKAKKSTKKKSSSLDAYSDYAQYFTIASAVLLGLVTLFGSFMETETTLLDNLTSILFLTTAIGGMTMGLLYLLEGVRKAK